MVVTVQAQDITKPRFVYLFCRSYCLIVLLGWNVYGIREFFLDRAEIPTFSPLELSVIPAIFMLFSLTAFPFRYSLFGQLKRAPWPEEKPLCTSRSTWGQVGLMTGTVPFFDWYAFPSGLGFSILGVGRGFIPYESIVAVEKSSFWKSGYRVKHSWPEIRNPVVLPHKRMYDAVAGRVSGPGVSEQHGIDGQ